MVDNLVKKVVKCLLNWGVVVKYCLHRIGSAKSVTIQSSEVSTIQGCLSIEVNRRQLRFSQVSTI